MTTALAERPQHAPALDPRVVQEVLLGGDLSKLSPPQRIAYYNRVCESIGLNPLTQPFAYIRLNGKEVLYAKKDATEQLRFIHQISIDPKGFVREVIEGVYVVTAPASMPSGRTDVSTGAVPIDGLKGEARANAMMKAETKAKRRVTLSICGLGMLDETEVETLKADPPPLVIETKPELRQPVPEGYVYIERIDMKRKGSFEWADVTLSTGETVIAKGQIIALLEQVAQDGVAVDLVTETVTNKRGDVHQSVLEAHRYAPPATTTEPAPDSAQGTVF